MMKTRIDREIRNCQFVPFKKNQDSRGQLTHVEVNKEIPFDVKRVYYIQNVPSGHKRGEHAHKNLEQILIALSGSFEVLVDDGYAKQSYLLNHSQQGLYIGSFVWHELKKFSANAICLVLASELYDESDYIRDYNEFLTVLS